MEKGYQNAAEPWWRRARALGLCPSMFLNLIMTCNLIGVFFFQPKANGMLFPTKVACRICVIKIRAEAEL